MGDISFSLTLKSRIEEETNKIIKELNKVDSTGKQAQNALEAISEATKGIGDKGGAGLKKLSEFISELRNNIKIFSSEDFFSPKKVQQLEAVENGLYRIGRILEDVSKKGTGFSIFPNDVSTETNKAKRELHKLSSFIDEINKRHGEGVQLFGVDATNNIRQSLSELSKYRTELEQIRNNGGIHPITGLTASDVVNSAGFLNAIDDAKTYAKEIKQSLKDADAAKKASIEEEKKNEQIVENILQRRAQERQRAAEKEAEIERQRQEQAKISAQIAQENANSEIKWNEQKAKAFSEALQRQMKASVEAEKKRQVSLFSNGFDTTILEKRIAMLNRIKEIQDQLAYYHPKAQYAFLDYESGLKFGNANTPGMRHKEDELQRLRNIIADLESEFNKLGGNEAFKNVDSQIKSLEQTIARLKESGGSLNLGKMLGLENKSTDEFRIAKEAAMATEAHAKRQNELTAAFEKYFNVQKQVEDAERRLAEATARTNQARREAIAASRQQAESLIRDRVKELEAQRQQLQGLFGSGKNVLSTQELIQLQQAFSQITQELNTLRSAMNNLGSYSIKDLFSIGRGTSEYTPLINSMRTVIDQKQEAINLERKHQEEITRTAAKARNDLAAAFAGANAEAKKMQSIVGDIKSLFLQGGLVFGAQQFFNSIVQTGGEIVQQHVALRSILGDVQKADELFAQTQQLALQSPFKFGELNRDVKQLAAFGVEANDLYDTTKRLADIASGLGVDFGRLGLAFGQVKARSWLDGKELRQFAYAGLPLLQRITELYNSEGKNGKNNYTTADVKKMISGRQVSFEDVQKVLWKMTDEGGQFYNMQFVLSETLLGRWNKLIDAWDIMLGKFAEGKNVVGGTFSFLINRTTDLVLALDKVSNAALAFGAMYALRKGATAIASRVGISSNLAALHAEQQVKLRTFAVEQQQALIEGKITQEKMRQNIADYQGMLNSKINTRNAVEQAALEGRLSALKMQKAFREGLISKEMIEQLRLMGMISAKEAELITKEGTRARMSLAVNQAKGKLGGFFSGWNIATLGITIGTALYSAYSQFKDSIKQDTDRINETAKTTVKTLSDTLSEVGNKGTGETLQQQVDKMTDVLKQSGLYTDSIKEQIDSTEDLGKEYDILKQKIIDARNENNFTPGEGENFAKAKKASGAGFAGGASWFGQWTGVGQDDIDENINDVAENLTQLQMKMEKFGDSTKSSMEKVANSMLGARAAGMTFEEKLYTLYKTGGNGAATWRIFVDKVSNGNKDMKESLENLEDDLRHFGVNFREIATDDIPKYLEYMAKSRNMDMVEFSRWCKQHPDKFRTMLDQMLSEANKKVPGLVARLQSVAMAILNIGKAKPQEGNTGPKVWKNPNKVGTIERKAFDKLQKAGKLKGGKGGFWQKEMAEYLHNLNGGNSNGWTSFGEAVRKRYKEVRDENDNAKNAGDRQPYIREQRMLEAIAAQSGISLDVGKNKVTGHFGKNKNKNGRQEDVELKRLQERIDGFKKARQTYQKYKDVMSEQQAKDLVYSLYPNIKGLDLNDYLGSIAKITPSDAWFNKSTERKKFQTSLNREKADWRFSDELKPEFDRIAADFNESMNKLSERWDLYKSLLEKTGSKFFAESAWVDAFQMDDKTKSLMDEYYAHYHEIFNLQDSLSMTDGEAKEKLKLPNQYEEWKKITELLRGNYVKSLQDGAEAISQTMSVAQKLDAITDKYDKKRKNSGDNKELVERYDYLERQEKSGIIFNQLKNEINWDGIFGSLDNYTKKELRKIRKQIRELVAGGILDGMSTTDLKSFYDGMEKLNQAIDGQGFSGLSDLIREMVDASTKYDEAVKEYNAAVSKYGKDDWRTEAASKKMHEAENRKRNTSGSVTTKKNTILGNIETLAGMFKTLGMSNGSGSALLGNAGDWTSAIMKMSGSSDKNSSKVGGIVGMFAGLTEAIGEKGFGGFLSDAFEDIGNAVNSIFKDIFGLNLGISGADYSDYNKAKAEYDNLINVWDTLISKKKQYLSEHWGTEAQNASKEALALLNSEIEQTKIIARDRLNSGASAGSHSIWYRMWKGSYDYNGTNWRDVAGNISSKYGVQLNGMEDMLNMSPKVLENIKTEYSGLWAHMDGDFRDYLDKLIEYSDQVDDMTESITEKLTGNKFSDLVSSWGDAMSAMANSSDNLVEHFEDNLKKTILNSMIENIYGDKINALLKKTQGYAENGDKIKDSNGNVISEYTGTEYADVKNSTEELSKQIEATRDYLKKTYGWSDNSSSSSRNSVKSITEETGDLIASYLNAIRLDCSVMRAEQAKYYPEMSEIAKSQLSQLNAIARNTLRNADAAERIESIFTEYNDNFNRVLNGTKSLKMK